MNVLIIYAHPEPKSFNGALKDQAVAELSSLGHEVKVSDLYAMKFKAVADRDDFLNPSGQDFLKYAAEQQAAAKDFTFAKDIQDEQEKLVWADFIIFQFPMWWYSAPAILKGWIDRVLASGFAYGGGMAYDTGGLKGKKVMLSLTAGYNKEVYDEYGIEGEIYKNILSPIHRTLFFTGLIPVDPFIAWEPSQGDELRKKYLEEYKGLMSSLSSLPPIPFHPRSHYDDELQLKAEYR